MAKVKKKTQHINKITPTVNAPSGIQFDKLEAGECFLMSGSLFMKETGNDQIALNLATGKYSEGLCETDVEPVVVVITWEKK